MRRAMGIWGRPVAVLGALLLLVGCNTLMRQQGEYGPDGYEGDGPEGRRPRLLGDPSMCALAWDLDHLERHIDWYGSVTAKMPDVWGQARLTQYRDEFEKQMSGELNGFSFVLNGSISRADDAFFASATALSFAVQPPAPVIGSSTSTKGSAPNLNPTAQTTTQLARDPTTGALTATQTTLAPKSSSPVKPLDIADPSTLISDPNQVISRDPVRLPKALGFATAGGAIGIEPTEYLAQKKRYLDFLNQLRRENEGDDTADSPGYSLNLMRIPVSILPGKRTDKGFGAEITMSLNPILGDDLLPMTFRNLLTNDVETQLGTPLTQILNGDGGIATKFLTPDFEKFIHMVTRINDYNDDPDRAWGHLRLHAYVNYLNSDQGRRDVIEAFERLIKQSGSNTAFADIQSYLYDQPPNGLGVKRPTGAAPASTTTTSTATTSTATTSAGPVAARSVNAAALQTVLTNLGAGASTLVPSLSFANGLDNRTAFPTSQLIDVYGPEAAFDIFYAANQAFKGTIQKQKYAHLPDVQALLREEGRGAFEFLKKNPQLWWHYCTPQLVQAIRSQRFDEVTRIRQGFRKEVAFLTQSEPTGADPHDPVHEFDPGKAPQQYSDTTGLAWALIVDGALLTDRLIRDMKETASAKGQSLAAWDYWRPYFLPDPPAECRHVFNEYVKLRWPIHVFALDPYIQEQNIADSLSTRRETQLALSIAFTNGQINARQLTRFTRRLEAEFETIDLNRTQVGFSHGENTFGWRFYPRYQTPDTKSNLEVLFRDNIIGGLTRNQLLRDRRLEPGIRECVAIVMMPSFVPYMNVDTVSNWFPLTNPKHKVLDHTHALKLSRTVQTIKTEGCAVKDASKYRPGEFERLLHRADQLADRLPTQTFASPVPILNTFGGFEMFSNGTTDLAPELFGWYGAPGIDPEAPSTTLFLVGDHFSPLRTHVIVGNQVINNTQAPYNQVLLSRQVMQVTFGPGAYQVSGSGGAAGGSGGGGATGGSGGGGGGGGAGGSGGVVRIHVATPYGVTRELEVPVVKQKPQQTTLPGFTFGQTAKLTVQYGWHGIAPVDGTAPKTFMPVPSGAEEKDLRITWNAPSGTLTSQVKVEMEFLYGTTTTLKVPCHGCVIGCVQDKAATPATGTSGTATTTPGAASTTPSSTSATPATTPSTTNTLELKEIVLSKAMIDYIAQDLVAQIAALGPIPGGDSNPLAKGLKSTKVTITPLTPHGYVVQSATTNDSLTIVFKQMGACQPGVPVIIPPAPPCPCPNPAWPIPPALMVPQHGAQPYCPQPGPQQQPHEPLWSYPSPSGAIPGPSGPIPGPSSPIPGPTGPIPGPTGPIPGPSSPIPGPASPIPGPAIPVPTPQGSSSPPMMSIPLPAPKPVPSSQDAAPPMPFGVPPVPAGPGTSSSN